jgi:hypothetical protein
MSEYDLHRLVRKCELCGFEEIIGYDSSKPSEQRTVQSFYPGTSECPRCEDAWRRSPEIVSWVLGIVAVLNAKLTAEKETA